MFYGEYKHTIDAKGRLFIPAKFREKLGDEFILSPFDDCIRVYPMPEWEKFTAKLAQLPAAKERDLLRFFYAFADDGSIDSQGRVTINQSMRNFAHLEKEVVITGGCTHFEIWTASAWEAKREKFDSQKIMKELSDLGL